MHQYTMIAYNVSMVTFIIILTSPVFNSRFTCARKINKIPILRKKLLLHVHGSCWLFRVLLKKSDSQVKECIVWISRLTVTVIYSCCRPGLSTWTWPAAWRIVWTTDCAKRWKVISSSSGESDVTDYYVYFRAYPAIIAASSVDCLDHRLCQE